MPLRAKVNYPRIDFAKTEKEIHEALLRATVDSCKSWVITVTNQTPVWSGASKASFLKLAAITKVQLLISPVAPSRIPLGIGTSTGELIIDKNKSYGWTWSSGLDYIHIVEDRYGMLADGNRSLKPIAVNLPQPTVKEDGNDG